MPAKVLKQRLEEFGDDMVLCKLYNAKTRNFKDCCPILFVDVFFCFPAVYMHILHFN